MENKSTTFTDIRCAKCNRLLAQFSMSGEGTIRVQCRCKMMNIVKQSLSKDHALKN